MCPCNFTSYMMAYLLLFQMLNTVDYSTLLPSTQILGNDLLPQDWKDTWTKVGRIDFHPCTTIGFYQPNAISAFAHSTDRQQLEGSERRTGNVLTEKGMMATRNQEDRIGQLLPVEIPQQHKPQLLHPKWVRK